MLIHTALSLRKCRSQTIHYALPHDSIVDNVREDEAGEGRGQRERAPGQHRGDDPHNRAKASASARRGYSADAGGQGRRHPQGPGRQIEREDEKAELVLIAPQRRDADGPHLASGVSGAAHLDAVLMCAEL